MTIGQILLAIITGLIANEFCDVSPWLARKLVRWSARRRYVRPARAELRAEELEAYIDDQPGRLSKLITAIGFAVAAVASRKVSLGVVPLIPLWWPTTPTVPVHYEDGEWTLERRHPQFRVMYQSWCQLTDEIRNAAKEIGAASRSWRRCIKKMRRITGDDRWKLVENNLDLLKEIKNPRANLLPLHFGHAGHRFRMDRWSIPTGSTITCYQNAVETARAEIRRLTSDFLLSSAPR